FSDRMIHSFFLASIRSDRGEVYNPGVGGGTNRGVVVAAAVFAIVLAAVLARSGGPPPRPANAASSQFSAVRARDALHAIIDAARAVRTEHFRNTIVFLVTDGEEAGLLGAEAFVADGDAAKKVAAVINVDSRGTSGASYMFETSRNNRRLIPIVARALPRPAT